MDDNGNLTAVIISILAFNVLGWIAISALLKFIGMRTEEEELEVREIRPDDKIPKDIQAWLDKLNADERNSVVATFRGHELEWVQIRSKESE